jgi:heme-degrading monooxygenase HmoA
MPKYAVIFRAEIRALDAEYAAMAARLRELAIEEYGCVEFFAVTEGCQEVAISYWDSEAQITNWKQNAEHLVAQENGRNQWYRSYSVEVAEVVRSYSSEARSS